MDDVRKELENRQRITHIYNKGRDAFDSKEAYDNYLETVEDIIYKLTYNVDVAEVEQQVQDYIRQEAALAGVKPGADAATYVPVTMGAMMQPVPLVAVQQDAEGRLIPSNTAQLSGQPWQLMAKASGWSEELVMRRALQDAFSTIFLL